MRTSYSLIKNRFFRIILIISLIIGGIVVYKNYEVIRIPACTDCNIILISIDTLRPDHMGIYGYGKNTTPNIDNWAKKGIIFQRTYTIFPETWESFFTLFTGRKDFLNDQNKSLSLLKDKESNIPTLTDILKDLNYKTTAFVTNPALSYPFFSKGFDNYTHINESPTKKEDITSYTYDYQNSKVLTEKANEWISNNFKNKFFLWLHYSTPHGPYNPKPQYICKIGMECNLKKYKNFLEENPPYSILKNCQKNDALQIQLASNLYDAEILSVDERIGEISKMINKLNINEKTLIVIYGDHGEGFDHNNFAHSDSLYESHIRIPFIIMNPKSNKQKKIYALKDNTEIRDIVLNLISKKNNYEINRTSSNQMIYSTTSNRYSNTYSLVSEKYSYIYSFKNICTGKPSEEFFDLSIDPNELNNLVGKNSIVKKYSNILMEYLKKIQIKEKSLEQQDFNELKSLGY